MLRPTLFVILGFLLACTGTDSTAEAECDGDLDIDRLSLTSDGDGLVTIPVTVDESDASFMVLTQRSEGLLSTDGVTDPNGDVALSWEDWSNSRESLTYAFYAVAEMSVLNWPVREEDGPLTAGEWTVVGSTLDDEGYYRGNKDVEVTVIRRNCLGKKTTLAATIAYARGLDEDPEVSAAVEAAVERWVEIYGAYDIVLEPTYVSTTLSPNVEEPIVGSPEYEALYEEVGGEGIVLVVAEDVGGYSDLYGEAGGLPGPVKVASPMSAVAVSWLVHAGADARFSQAEVEILAETMAHEAGHYIGLFHPVEIGATSWDALSDTDKCTSDAACEKKLADNLMFPYPVCDGNDCVVADQLSNDQAGVVRSYVGVR